jgi:hypothetical protein
MRRAHPVTRSLFLGDILTGFEGTGWEGVEGEGGNPIEGKSGELSVIIYKENSANLQLNAIFTIGYVKK